MNKLNSVVGGNLRDVLMNLLIVVVDFVVMLIYIIFKYVIY